MATDIFAIHAGLRFAFELGDFWPIVGAGWFDPAQLC